MRHSDKPSPSELPPLEPRLAQFPANKFDISTKGNILVCLPNPSRLNHSCLPNCAFQFRYGK